MTNHIYLYLTLLNYLFAISLTGILNGDFFYMKMLLFVVFFEISNNL